MDRWLFRLLVLLPEEEKEDLQELRRYLDLLGLVSVDSSLLLNEGSSWNSRTDASRLLLLFHRCSKPFTSYHPFFYDSRFIYRNRSTCLRHGYPNLPSSSNYEIVSLDAS